MNAHPRRGHTVRMDAPASIRSRPDNAMVREHEPESLELQPMATIDLMISLGWGDTPQDELPDDWRTRRNPEGSCGW